MPVGSSLNITLPTVGQLTWGGTLNTVLQMLVDAIEAQVPVSALDVGASLDMQGQLIINADGLGFSTNDPGTANSLFMSGGELYCRDGNNTVVQITSGGTINVSVSGGFGGNYAGNGLAVFSSAGNLFTFTSVAGVYSVMESGQLKIHNGSSVGYTSLKPPSGQSSNIDLTFPPALPSGLAYLTVDATGTMNALAVTNAVTSSINMAKWMWGASQADIVAGTVPVNGSGNGWTFVSAGAGKTIVCPLDMAAGDTLVRFRTLFSRVEINKTSAPGTASLELLHSRDDQFGPTVLEIVVSTTGSTPQTMALTGTYGQGIRVATTGSYAVRFTAASTGSTVGSSWQYEQRNSPRY